MTYRWLIAAAALVVAAPASLVGQQADRDASWVVYWDDPAVADTSLFLVVMRPGWHVTTPAASGVTLLQPDSVARGSFLLKAVVFTFNADAGPMGLVLAGRPGTDALEEYLSFLVANDGTFALFHHAGTARHTIVPWTPSDAIVRKTAGSEGTAKNVLTVLADGEAVRFYLNGVEVNRRSAEQLQTAGIVGLRAGPGTNLHVSELTVAALGSRD